MFCSNIHVRLIFIKQQHFDFKFFRSVYWFLQFGQVASYIWTVPLFVLVVFLILSIVVDVLVATALRFQFFRVRIVVFTVRSSCIICLDGFVIRPRCSPYPFHCRRFYFFFPQPKELQHGIFVRFTTHANICKHIMS